MRSRRGRAERPDRTSDGARATGCGRDAVGRTRGWASDERHEDVNEIGMRPPTSHELKIPQGEHTVLLHGAGQRVADDLVTFQHERTGRRTCFQQPRDFPWREPAGDEGASLETLHGKHIIGVGASDPQGSGAVPRIRHEAALAR